MERPIQDETEAAGDVLQNSKDAFDNIIAENTRIVVDQPATVPFSRERYRYYEDAGSGYTRINDPHSDSSFTDNKNHFLISCPAGEKREIRTSERAVYQVSYEAVWSIAWRARNQLSSGQSIRVRLTDTPREDQVVIRYYNDGNGLEAEAYLETNSGKATASGAQKSFTPNKNDVTEPRISKCYSNFYGVGEHRIVESFLDINGGNVSQENNNVATIGRSTDWALESFNLHIGIEVDCSNSSSGLDLEYGSTEYKIRANTQPSEREKGVRVINNSYSGSGNYEPVAAYRIDPNRDQIPVDIEGTELVDKSGTPGSLVAVAAYPEQVTVNANSGSWTSADQVSSDTSVIQQTTDVTQIEDSSGTLVSDIPQVHDGLRQVSVSSTASKKSASGAGSASTIKRPVHNDEIIVILLKTDGGASASDEYNFRAVFSENW